MDTQKCIRLKAEPKLNANYGRFWVKTFWKDAIYSYVADILWRSDLKSQVIFETAKGCRESGVFFSAKVVVGIADMIGIDIVNEPQFLWIAEEASRAHIPPDWKELNNEDGDWKELTSHIWSKFCRKLGNGSVCWGSRSKFAPDFLNLEEFLTIILDLFSRAG